MSASFVDRLRKDFKSNPKKAGLLGVLCLVAGWFWAPILFGGGGAPELKPAKPATKNPTMENVAGGVAKDQFVAPPWRKMMAWIEADSQYRPLAALWTERDPFAKVVTSKPGEIKSAPVVSEEFQVTPQAAQIVLNSTWISAARQIALINGKTYRVGDTIRGEKNKQPVKFTLTRIEPKAVTLARNGQEYQLKIRQVAIAHFEDDE